MPTLRFETLDWGMYKEAERIALDHATVRLADMTEPQRQAAIKYMTLPAEQVKPAHRRAYLKVAKIALEARKEGIGWLLGHNVTYCIVAPVIR